MSSPGPPAATCQVLAGLCPGQQTARVGVDGFLRSTCAALDPVLAPHGFAPGQAGGSTSEAQSIWCASYDDFAAHHPQLPPSGEQQLGRGACVDVVLTARDDGTGWRVAEVALEGHDLGACLRVTGDEGAAARADALPGAPLDRALGVLPSLLDQMLRR